MVRQKCTVKERQWRGILQRQAASGLSIRQFCNAEDLSEASFYAWRRVLATRAEEAGAAQNGAESRNAAGFIPLQLVNDFGGLEVVHPSGCCIRISGPVDAQRLQQVLAVLDQRGDS